MFGFAHSWFPPERNCMVNFGKYFTRDEFVCSHTGEAKMNQDFLDKLNQLREYYNKPMIISSGRWSAACRFGPVTRCCFFGRVQMAM